MFAIIEDGGRQYRVQPGQELAIDLRDDVEAGSAIVFDRVLLANAGGESVIGLPVIESATVSATVANPLHKGLKLEIQKFRRRKNLRRHTGHRQKYTTVIINELQIPGLQVVEKQEEAPAEPVTATAEA
ncbi:MAG: 50S ribosomal protein L21 [Planctomycetaceae bacterium]|nr:50S ribosomal protein L21 [Planctomycetaceae bacterium]